MRCEECGEAPAHLLIKGHRICGVCWHRGRILMDMVERIRQWRQERSA